MESLLFLCHRIPYPPNKGDKIRSYNFLRYLAQHYKVHLGTFIDDPADEVWRTKLAEYCADTCIVTINPTWRKLLSLRGLLTGEPLGLPYYREARLTRWVTRTLATARPTRALVFSSTMAQYLPAAAMQSLRTVVDFVDVDSEKWRAYAASKPWPLGAIYRREGERLLDYERSVAAAADASVFVSAPEAQLFNSLLDAPRGSVSHIDNGVDHAYFRSDASFASPYGPCGPVLTFTGAMDYWANIDAVTWFVHEVLPGIRQHLANAEFWIVGSRPTPGVKALANRSGVHVTGAVADIRPYLQHAGLLVAPLRIARGIQNKVLEGMAMEQRVVGTSAAFEGIGFSDPRILRVADTAADMIDACLDLLATAPDPARGGAGRGYVEAFHDWNRNLEQLRTLLEA